VAAKARRGGGRLAERPSGKPGIHQAKPGQAKPGCLFAAHSSLPVNGYGFLGNEISAWLCKRLTNVYLPNAWQ
jgi:hypothetical protein